MGLREPALTGRPMRVLVTGSSTGIGRALTLRLLDAGHAVWGWARSDQAALAAARPAFRATRTDVADWYATLPAHLFIRLLCEAGYGNDVTCDQCGTPGAAHVGNRCPETDPAAAYHTKVQTLRAERAELDGAA